MRSCLFARGLPRAPHDVMGPPARARASSVAASSRLTPDVAAPSVTPRPEEAQACAGGPIIIAGARCPEPYPLAPPTNSQYSSLVPPRWQSSGSASPLASRRRRRDGSRRPQACRGGGPQASRAGASSGLRRRRLLPFFENPTDLRAEGVRQKHGIAGIVFCFCSSASLSPAPPPTLPQAIPDSIKRIKVKEELKESRNIFQSY